MAKLQRGSLVVVGSGIQLVNHMTQEALQCIQDSERVFHVVADYPTEMWLKTLNPKAESLNSLYESGKPRLETYKQMVQVIMDHVRKGFKVCAVFYGHPGVFVTPGNEAIRRARSEGYEARMLPGISAEDCLFADLGVDPGQCGCQSFEATDFLVHKRRFDPSSVLIIWQIGAIGAPDYQDDLYSHSGISLLVDVLQKRYGAHHEVVVYEASPFPYPVAGPSIQKVGLAELPKARIAPASTLYVPPKESVCDDDMVRKLNLGMTATTKRLKGRR
ncbi:MAG: SAM-dependent methyltransferase [Methanomassiliicoccales archaeon]|jgi:uncharacterized protein YabN with tetrapyrrole methylase and pyrophosphatase domain